MKLRIDYDRTGLEVELPEANVLAVVRAPSLAAPPDATAVLREALAQPIASPPLRELARGRKSACIVIPDVTRPMPNPVVLPLILAELEAAGIPRTATLILIATGLHRPNEGEELRSMVGAELAASCRFANNVARDEASHVVVGTTSTGVTASVDRRYLEADLRIVLGLTEPHLMAGFSGGRKLICPGICSAATIRQFHSPPLIEHPRSTNCVLTDNPTHRTSTEIARLARCDFTLNVVLDSARRILAAHAGDLEAAFLATTEYARGVVTCRIPRRADIVLVSGGGYPLDTTWYQTIKALVAAQAAVRPGGSILVASGLRQGCGSEEFASLIRETTELEGFMRRIREPGFHRNDQWQFEEFALVARQAEILLYTDGLSPEEQRGLFVTPVASPAEGLAAARRRHGPAATIIAMPHGPYVIPVVAPA